jgi:hypothetical protein
LAVHFAIRLPSPTILRSNRKDARDLRNGFLILVPETSIAAKAMPDRMRDGKEGPEEEKDFTRITRIYTNFLTSDGWEERK